MPSITVPRALDGGCRKTASGKTRLRRHPAPRGHRVKVLLELDCGTQEHELHEWELTSNPSSLQGLTDDRSTAKPWATRWLAAATKTSIAMASAWSRGRARGRKPSISSYTTLRREMRPGTTLEAPFASSCNVAQVEVPWSGS
uniref:Uncharacterized protein n=1 Tax=Arundo donax TaxID=35708 RepID=A0A0A9H6W8_ARUDO